MMQEGKEREGNLGHDGENGEIMREQSKNRFDRKKEETKMREACEMRKL